MQHANPRNGKGHEFTRDFDKKVYLLAGDIPSPDIRDQGTCCCAHAYSPLGHYDNGYGWVECPFCGAINVTQGCSIQGLSCTCERKYIRIDAIDQILWDIHCKKSNAFIDEIYTAKRQALLSWHNTPRLQAAYKAARSARFEHRDAPSELRRRVNDGLKQVSSLQEKAKKLSSQFDIPALTIEEVKEHWENIKKWVRSRKDGVKIQTFLNGAHGYAVVGVEGTKEHPVVVIQAQSAFTYKGLTQIAKCVETIEWAMVKELKQECKVRLQEPTSVEYPSLPDWDDM